MDDDRKVNFFKDVADLIDSVEDIDKLLNILLLTASRVMGSKAASMMLVDKVTDKLYFHISVGEKKGEVKRFELEKGEGIAGWVVEHDEPALVKDVNKDPRWAPEISQSIGMKTGSIACAPLRVNGEVIGVMELIDREDGGPLSEDDLDQLQAFCDMAAVALYKANIYRDVEEKNKELLEELGAKRAIIGNSAIIKKAIDDCRKVAESKATTLITGESGVGKELFARLIHDLSDRKNRAMVAINCGALPETLLERELFGHEKGAFTGAESTKPGLFESADGGTIFLDEIGETSQAMQVKLLRVLQEGSFFRIGGQHLIEVDVRVIAATNKDLDEQVKEKKFREDLFYRLNVVRIKLPPLRERKEDIPLLANTFLRQITKKLKPGVTGFANESLVAIQSYSWPGNIRQLENAVERAVIMSESARIQPGDLPREVTEIKRGDIQMGLTLKQAQDNFKKIFILQSLAFCGGNKTKTARMLSIQRTYLSRLIKELDIGN